MAIILQGNDPGVTGVKRAVRQYIKRYPDYREALQMYGAIMEAQQELLADLDGEVEMTDTEILVKLEGGIPLLGPDEVPIDTDRMMDLVEGICRIVGESREGGFSNNEEPVSWEGLKEGKIAGTSAEVLKGEKLSIGGDWAKGQEGEIASRVIWEALVPFYRASGSTLESRLDHSYWQIGYCPVCGSPPLIGKFRKGDGLWVLECSLCHTPWNVKRSHCPFCTERKEPGLEYLYIDGDDSRRVQYCGECGSYVKTINMRESEQESLLPLEDIVTVRLDLAARQEGLRPPAGFYDQGRSELPGSPD